MAQSARSSESGFTLAGLMIVLTVLMIFIAYTVPKQWSMAMQRERDKQTIFCMKQYARAILEWQHVHTGLPTSLDQLKQARSPRLIRGPKSEWIDPLTGEVDWILIPPGQAGQSGTMGPTGFIPGPSGSTGNSGDQNGRDSLGGGSSKGYVGPFIGVRPNKTGESFIELNGAKNYEQWTYTINELGQETAARSAALSFYK